MTKLEKIKSNEVSTGFIVLLFAGLFFALTIILYFSPLMLDDYEFLSYNYKSLGEAINYALCYGNGRFLGNLGAILLAPHTIIATVFKAFTVTFLCFLLPRLFDAKKKSVYLLSCLLILAVPEKMFAQVHAWNCGNVNYILPIILTVLCLMILKSEDAGRFSLAIKCVGIFVLGFCSQLFMEHNTLVNFIISAGLFLFFVMKRKTYGTRKCMISFFWTAATVLGTIAMLLIPKFFIGERTRDMSAYRGVEIESLKALIYRIYVNTDTIILHFASNFLLILIFGIITYLILKNPVNNKNCPEWIVKVFKVLNVICVCFDLIYCIFMKNLDSYPYRQDFFKLIIGSVCIFEILLFFIVCVVFLNREKRTVGVICLFLFACAMAPFLIIYPVKARTSFLGTIVLIFSALYFFNETVEKANAVVIDTKRHIVLMGSIVALVSCIFVSFLNINCYMKSLNNHIESEMKKGAKVIEIYKVPNQYCNYNIGMIEYKYYYQEYGDIEFKVISVDEWKQNRELEKLAENQK